MLTWLRRCLFIVTARLNDVRREESEKGQEIVFLHGNFDSGFNVEFFISMSNTKNRRDFGKTPVDINDWIS